MTAPHHPERPPVGDHAPIRRLLQCLAVLTRLYGDPRSPAALANGLPLVDGQLSPELFVRAAERVGIEARAVARRLDEIPDMVLPAVLLLENGTACLLLRREPGEKLRIQLAGADEKELSVERERLESLYAGRAILVRRHRDRPSVEEGAGRAWLWDTLRRFWPSYGQVLLAALMINLFALASPLFVMNVYDRVVPNQATDTLWVLAAGMLIVIVFEFALQLIRAQFLDNVGKRADVLLSSRIFARVLNIDLQATPVVTGTFANRLREFEGLREFISSATVVALVDLPFLLFFITALWLIGGPLALIPTLAIPAVVALGLTLQRPLRRAANRGAEESAQKHSILIETLAALETVKAFNLEGRMQRRWEESVADAARTTLSSRAVSTLAIQLSKSLIRLVTVAVIIYGVYRIGAGELSMGGLIACTILTGRAMEPLGQVASLLTRYHHAASALRGLDKIMSAPLERPEERRFLSRPAVRGRIEFRNVTFTFPGSNVPALRNVSFTVRPGEAVAVIGPVGSGKSTVAKLITGLYTPQEGTVLLDGTDIRQLDPSDLRDAVGFVQQEITLFQGSVRENIAVARPEASDELVLTAAQVAGADEFIARHPSGYDLDVGEKGGRLSGGQRQFIALARAILPDPPVFVMDEPTSMMDPSAQAHFLRQVAPLKAGKTLVLITHRPALFELVDRLIVMREGQVLADGPKETVLRNALGGGGARR
ncbi:type I secretion system permease/ATPase [Endothiovibrio diazotrophicus]